MTTPADKSPDSITPGKSIEPTGKSVPSGKLPDGFETHMNQAGKAPGAGQPPPTGPTPVDLARTPPVAQGAVTIDTIQSQAKAAQDALGTVGKQLNDKNLKLKRSQNHLVRQKLGDANNYINAAAAKLGAPATEQRSAAGHSGITRFLAMVNDGQDQLLQVQDQLNKMSAKKEQLNPGEMLSIQVKMGLAQQEIEYTSTLLSKVIQSITQILNTQL